MLLLFMTRPLSVPLESAYPYASAPYLKRQRTPSWQISRKKISVQDQRVAACRDSRRRAFLSSVLTRLTVCYVLSNKIRGTTVPID
jgi:hypothetical protein